LPDPWPPTRFTWRLVTLLSQGLSSPGRCLKIMDRGGKRISRALFMSPAALWMLYLGGFWYLQPLPSGISAS